MEAANFVGIILPPIIEIVNKDVKSDEERFLIACVTCFVVAAITHYNDLVAGNMQALGQAFLLILTEALGIFNLYWRNSFLRDKLQQGLGVNNTQELG